MAVFVENTSTLGRRLKVTVPDNTIQEQIKTKMAKLAREAHLKGFRPGKVPQQVLQKRFGESIRLEVINEVVRRSLTDAVQEKALQLAGAPKIEEIKESDQNLEFVATFEVYPEITLADISEVEIEKRTANINDADVKKMVEKLQDQLAEWDDVERPAQKGDRLTVDFARLLDKDGAHREEQTNVQLVVGNEGVLPGLSEALIGKKKGEQIEVDLRYPEDWAESEVAGMGVKLWVTIHHIGQKKTLSTEELAEKMGLEEKTLEAISEKVKARMQEELDQVLKDELKELVLEKLLEKNPIDLPQALIDQEKEAIYRELARARKGAAHHAGDDIDTQARRRVELGLLLNEVIKKYEIKADAQQVRAQIEKIAARFGQKEQIIQAYYGNHDLLQGIERMNLLEQAIDKLLNEIKLIEKVVSYEDVMNPQDPS